MRITRFQFEYRWLFIACLVLALSVPTLVTFSYEPAASVFNDALALIGWSIVALVALLHVPQVIGERGIPGGVVAAYQIPWMACVGLVLYTFAQLLLGAGETGSVVSHAAALLCAALVASLGVLLGGRELDAAESHPMHVAFATALIAAAAACACVGWVQYLQPGVELWGVAPLTTAGRIFANLRQPNHLALLLGWGLAAAVWLHASNKLSRTSLVGLVLVIAPVLILTGSRMGRVFLGLLIVLALLHPNSRAALFAAASALVTGVVTWYAAAYLHEAQVLPFFGVAREGGSATGSRAELWSALVSMIPQVPFFGCGVGGFNFCWTHADIHARTAGHWLHAHNIVLQAFVELGIVATVAFGFALLWPIFRNGARRQWRAVSLPLAVLAMVMTHAMLEFPLSYMYFLMPAAFAFGLVLAGVQPNDESQLQSAPQPWVWPRALTAAAVVVLALCGLLYASQYWKLRVFYSPAHASRQLDAAQLSALRGQTFLFRTHVDYSLLMTLSNTVEPHEERSIYAFFKQFGNRNLDGRLLARFSILAGMAGDRELALHLAWRTHAMYPADFEDLKQILRVRNDPRLSWLATYCESPSPQNVSMDRIRALSNLDAAAR
jgi:O-antigen ligase